MPGRKDNRTTEQEIAVAVLRICADAPSGECTTAELKRLIPQYINLTPDDLAQSPTRANEAVWEQIVRNIVSHRTVEGNIIAEGYAEHIPGGIKITDAGRLHLKHLGY
ncbi:MAG: hypothetical protein AB7K67_12005 [Hyphomicrobiaceae bacterium]